MKNEEVKEKKGTTAKKKNVATTKKQGATTNKNLNTEKKESIKKIDSKKVETKKAIPKKEAKSKNVEIKEEKEEIILEEEVVVKEGEATEGQEIKEKKKLKLGDILLVAGLILVVILGCFVLKGEKEELSYTLPLTLSGDNGLHQLSYQEYQEKIDNGETFVLIVERATCSHCVNFMPVAEDFAKDNVPMYYVDTDTFSEEDWETFEKSNTFFKKKSGNWGTPTTIVLAGNTAVDYIEGETTADKLEELYNNYFDRNAE